MSAVVAPNLATGHVFIATSLNGYIARADGAIDWLTSYATMGEDHGYDEFIRTVDAFVMGRKTYEKALTFDAWPFTGPVVVLSRTVSQGDVRRDLTAQVRITSSSPRELVDMLTKEGRRRLYVDGGQVIQAFLREGLIADMTITRVPIILADGLPLFGPAERDIRMTHLETNTFASGLVQSKYRVG